MLEYKKEICTHNSFKLAASIFCNCGIPFGRRYRNFPCYHLFCESCTRSHESTNKCSMCQSLVEKVEELHPNEDILVCTVPNCNQAFMNFPSLKIHTKISHSINIDTVEEFYEKFGDSDISIPNSKIVKIENSHFKPVKSRIYRTSPSHHDSTHQDSTGPESPRLTRKASKSDENQDQLEILM